MKNLVKIKKALISVSDKTNLEKIVSVLLKYKIKIISSGGTYKKIKKLNYDCTEISEYTGFHEILNGRVKTLHPKIHAGILSVRDNKKHKKDLLKNNYDEIDLVIVNFYPFEQILKKKNNSDFIIENIDIGGPTMVRAAAKNFKDVVTITNPNNYQNFIDEVNKYKGSTSIKFRENSASYAFNEIAYYDSLISNYFNNKTKNLFPHKKTLSGVLSENLRYGENPHQNASLYKLGNENSIKQLHGKRLSFNNYNDIFSALNVLKQFKKKIATVIVKHSNPCGISINKNNFKSYESALNCDPRSAFGGVIACNYIIKKKLAKRINKNFFEVIIGNGFDLDALNILKKKKKY